MSDENFRAVVEPAVACKCCSGTARLYGVVDFNKNCETGQGRPVLSLSGIPVYYHRCPNCGFIFTTFTDQWTPDEFAKHIYNNEYALVDPDYADTRPRASAQTVEQLWGLSKHLRVLDYGGGNGLTARLLREAGFKHVEVYDPFVPEFAKRPEGQFSIITMFEVLEHSPTPKETMADLASMLADAGVVTLSTLLQPQKMDQIGVSWWYLSPRNGHVSMHSRRSLSEIVTPLGLRVGSFNDVFHVLVRGRPEFAQHIKGL